MQKCLCGMIVWLERKLDGGITTSQRAIRQEEVQLPQGGTKIHRCLMAIVERYPTTPKTAEIAEHTGLQSKETASLVVALMARGLVNRVEERRGLKGGSVWELSHVTKKLLGIKGGLTHGSGA